jgi:2-polyprenyl-3-methyl-5-hydroxy-6-metoxy-1,4-benzoquinol methylase
MQSAALVGYSADPMKTARRKKEWFDDDSFWRELYPFMFPEKRIADADEQVGKALALTKPEEKSVLDLCCGPGRCSIALAKRGFRVTGVDRTTHLLKKARAKARTAHVKIEWVQKDMRDFVRPGSFALVLSMFTSFGYFDDRQEDMTVLENMFTSLQPGGACLIEVLGKERLAKILQSTTSTVLPDGTVLVERHEIFDDWTRVGNEWLVIRNGRVKSFKFHHTIYSGQELRDRMERVGFVAVKLHGNLDGDAYGPNAERLIAIGRKPISKHLEKGPAADAAQ